MIACLPACLSVLVDVCTHVPAQIDRDIDEIADTLSLTPPDYLFARNLYRKGKYSAKQELPDGKIEMRTLKSLSALSQSKLDKMKKEFYFKLYSDYWGRADYADALIEDGFGDAGELKGASDVVREVLILNAIQFETLWMVRAFS